VRQLSHLIGHVLREHLNPLRHLRDAPCRRAVLRLYRDFWL
jgi:hypothetical protein